MRPCQGRDRRFESGRDRRIVRVLRHPRNGRLCERQGKKALVRAETVQAGLVVTVLLDCCSSRRVCEGSHAYATSRADNDLGTAESRYPGVIAQPWSLVI